jgi:hypothetical protein
MQGTSGIFVQENRLLPAKPTKTTVQRVQNPLLQTGDEDKDQICDEVLRASHDLLPSGYRYKTLGVVNQGKAQELTISSPIFASSTTSFGAPSS